MKCIHLILKSNLFVNIYRFIPEYLISVKTGEEILLDLYLSQINFMKVYIKIETGQYLLKRVDENDLDYFKKAEIFSKIYDKT